jgi:Fe-S cluster biogenesis protein NfuA
MSADALRRVIGAVVEPLIRADRGELFVVQLSADVVALHLRGKFSGCPGNTLAIRRVIEPAVLAVAPLARVSVTTGENLPDRAVPWRDHQATL